MSTESSESKEYQARYQQLLGETAKIPWSELQLFFAKGNVVKVASALDLVDAATRVSLDVEQSVSGWIEAGWVQKVPDDDAKSWFETQAALWAVVVSPWVLVQTVEDRQSRSSESE